MAYATTVLRVMNKTRADTCVSWLAPALRCPMIGLSFAVDFAGEPRLAATSHDVVNCRTGIQLSSISICFGLQDRIKSLLKTRGESQCGRAEFIPGPSLRTTLVEVQ